DLEVDDVVRLALAADVADRRGGIAKRFGDPALDVVGGILELLGDGLLKVAAGVVALVDDARNVAVLLAAALAFSLPPGFGLRHAAAEFLYALQRHVGELAVLFEVGAT